VAETNPLITFRLQGDENFVCQRPKVIAAAQASEGVNKTPQAVCLITGERAEIERLHAAIKGVWYAQTSGANIVSFNLAAFNSYGKAQGDNAPVGHPAAFGYTTALNHLLARNSRNRVQVGDTSTVCWAERPTDLEKAIPDLFGEPPKDDPDRGVAAVTALYSAIHSGRLAGPEGDTRFYVLGLAPNAARIAIRVFHCLPLRELATRIQRHIDDLQLVRGPKDPEFLSLFRLLISCTAQGKSDKIPPNLGGAIVDAILAGPNAPYPSALLNAAVIRSRAEQDSGYVRTAVIKACLNRLIRQRGEEREFNAMLDLDNANPAYRLGRLFAALEKIQEEANPGINATIRDRYYGAASSTPVAVFTTLLRLKNAHLKKLPDGRAVWFEKLLGEVLGPIADFPAHLALPDQGRFALGYYHQRQAFFARSGAIQSTNQEGE
jgi:CRISPR-associated protein Csd1